MSPAHRCRVRAPARAPALPRTSRAPAPRVTPPSRPRACRRGPRPAPASRWVTPCLRRARRACPPLRLAPAPRACPSRLPLAPAGPSRLRRALVAAFVSATARARPPLRYRGCEATVPRSRAVHSRRLWSPRAAARARSICHRARPAPARSTPHVSRVALRESSTHSPARMPSACKRMPGACRVGRLVCVRSLAPSRCAARFVTPYAPVTSH